MRALTFIMIMFGRDESAPAPAWTWRELGLGLLKKRPLAGPGVSSTVAEWRLW